MIPFSSSQIIAVTISSLILIGCKSRQENASLSATSNPCAKLFNIADSVAKKDAAVTGHIQRASSEAKGMQLTPPPEDASIYPFLDDMNFARLHHDKSLWTPEKMRKMIELIQTPPDFKSRIKDIDLTKYVKNLELEQGRYQKLASVGRTFRQGDAVGQNNPCIFVKIREVNSEEIRAFLLKSNNGETTATDPNTFVLPPKIWASGASSYNDTAVDQGKFSNAKYVDGVINRARVKIHPYWINLANVKRGVSPYISDALAGFYARHLLSNKKPSHDELLDDLASIRSRPIAMGMPDPIGQVLSDWLWVDNEVFGQMQQKGWSPESRDTWQAEIDQRLQLMAVLTEFANQYPPVEKKQTIKVIDRLKMIDEIRPYEAKIKANNFKEMIRRYQPPKVGTYLLIEKYRDGKFKGSASRRK